MTEIVVTFKGNMSKPWIVVHGDDEKEVRELMMLVQDPSFLDLALQGEATYTAHIPRTPDQMVQQELGGVPVVPESAPTAPAAPVWGQGTPATPAAFSGPPAGVKSCTHGPMTLKEGWSSRGPWSAWMCKWGDQDTRCQPVDAVTGKPWPKK